MRNKESTLEAMEAIASAIESVSDDIQTSTDPEDNAKRAEIIKTLAEAYATVSGKERRQ